MILLDTEIYHRKFCWILKVLRQELEAAFILEYDQVEQGIWVGEKYFFTINKRPDKASFSCQGARLARGIIGKLRVLMVAIQVAHIVLKTPMSRRSADWRSLLFVQTWKKILVLMFGFLFRILDFLSLYFLFTNRLFALLSIHRPPSDTRIYLVTVWWALTDALVLLSFWLLWVDVAPLTLLAVFALLALISLLYPLLDVDQFILKLVGSQTGPFKEKSLKTLFKHRIKL